MCISIYEYDHVPCGVGGMHKCIRGLLALGTWKQHLASGLGEDGWERVEGKQTKENEEGIKLQKKLSLTHFQSDHLPRPVCGVLLTDELKAEKTR